MSVAVLKWHHPCFCAGFDFLSADVGFQPPGGLFCPFHSGDIFFAPADGFSARRPGGTCRNSRLGLASSADRCRTSNRTIGIELSAIAMRACLRSCKHRKHVIEKRIVRGSFRISAVALSKARSWPFGLFLDPRQ
jgi:hypothetical protein